ncbi:hypothetical protein V1509DRAFT_628282 [Lipomyces kononenkoae]
MPDMLATEVPSDHAGDIPFPSNNMSENIDIIENIINDSDQAASVEAAATLLGRQPSLRNANAEIFLDPDAFSDLANRQTDSGFAQSSQSSALASGTNSSGSSPAANFGKAIFKKIVPSKLRLGLRRRMSAPIAPTSPIASLSSPLFATSQQGLHTFSITATTALTSPLTPQQQNADGYFDLDIASNTNLETGEFFPSGATVKNNSSRHSLLVQSSAATVSPAPTSSPQLQLGTAAVRSEASYPVVVSPSASSRTGGATPTSVVSTPLTSSEAAAAAAAAALGTASISHSPLPTVTGQQQTISSSVLAASAAMSAVISSSPPIPPSPLATRPPPELSEIPTPLSPTPISAESSAVPSPRPTSALAFEGPVSMITTPSGSSVSGSRAAQLAGLSMTSLSAGPPSNPIPVQQLQQRLYHQFTLQESHDASLADDSSLISGGEYTSGIAPTASTTSLASQATIESGPAVLVDEEAIVRAQIAALYEKMRAEDQAFEATENRLGESGWTSEAELAAIRKNRLAARRKWEQAIGQVEASLNI